MIKLNQFIVYKLIFNTIYFLYKSLSSFIHHSYIILIYLVAWVYRDILVPKSIDPVSFFRIIELKSTLEVIDDSPIISEKFAIIQCALWCVGITGFLISLCGMYETEMTWLPRQAYFGSHFFYDNISGTPTNCIGNWLMPFKWFSKQPVCGPIATVLRNDFFSTWDKYGPTITDYCRTLGSSTDLIPLTGGYATYGGAFNVGFWCTTIGLGWIGYRVLVFLVEGGGKFITKHLDANENAILADSVANVLS